MALVGIIANPASGKDIRRLVAHGSVFDNQEKVRIVRRVLLGLSAVGVRRICYMPDTFGIVPRALDPLKLGGTVFYPPGFRLTGRQEDSLLAARFMAREGARCIVTLGGDGTNRVVAKGCDRVPILPISTGTNNVFPFMVEGTLAGLAAGLLAQGRIPLEQCTVASTRLEVVLDGEPADTALVDAVVCEDLFVGSRAVWDMQRVRQIFLNRARPDSIGMSAIGGLLRPIEPEEPRALYLELGDGGRPVTAPIAPGVIREVPVKREKILTVGEQMPVLLAPSVLALDGEREVEIRKGRSAAVRLREDGPVVVDVARTMLGAVRLQVLAP